MNGINEDGRERTQNSRKTGAPGADPSVDLVHQLSDRAGAIESINRIAGAVDAGDWTLVENMLTDEVEIDLSAVDGADPVTVGSTELVDRLQKRLSGLDATQHLLTNHVLNRPLYDSASGTGYRQICEAHLYAKHYLLNYRGGDSWTFGGHCSFGLTHDGSNGPGGAVEWRVYRMGFVMLWGEGNERILELAKSRYSAGLAGSAPHGPRNPRKKEMDFG